jgi:fluoride exporter
VPVVVAVAAGGALGALARYGLDRLIERRSFSLFPWSTFAINVSGCFVVGLVIGSLVDRHHAPQWVRAALVVGFCGAYTTFSTFAQETLDLTEANDYSVALLNVSASVIAGLAAVFLGNHLGRAL